MASDCEVWVVQGAGKVSANGTYLQDGEHGGRPQWLKDDWRIYWYMDQWVVERNGREYYCNDEDVGGRPAPTGWEAYNEKYNPAPTLSQIDTRAVAGRGSIRRQQSSGMYVMGPGFYKVVRGSVVRKTVDAKSPKMGGLNSDQIVKILEVRRFEERLRGRVVKPVAGWISLMSTNGETVWATPVVDGQHTESEEPPERPKRRTSGKKKDRKRMRSPKTKRPAERQRTQRGGRSPDSRDNDSRTDNDSDLPTQLPSPSSTMSPATSPRPARTNTIRRRPLTLDSLLALEAMFKKQPQSQEFEKTLEKIRLLSGEMAIKVQSELQAKRKQEASVQQQIRDLQETQRTLQGDIKALEQRDNKRKQILTRVETSRNEKHASLTKGFEEWDPEQTCLWLSSLEDGRFARYSVHFGKSGVDGELMKTMTEPELQSIIHHIRDKRDLMKHITALRKGEVYDPREDAGVSGETEYPNEFLCPITMELMINPVIASDGHTYEKDAITNWLQDHSTSPKTNQKLPNNNLVENHSLRALISDFKEKQKGKLHIA